MAQAKDSKQDKPVYRVLLYVQTAEDASILQDILTGIGAEGVVCTDLGDLCWRTAQDADAVLLTDHKLTGEALPVLAEALQGQPEWSDLQQLLAAAKFHVGLLSRRAGGDEELLEMVGQVKVMLVEAIEKSRSLSHELSPPGLSKSDPHETFEWLTQQFQTKHGLTVYLDTREGIELPSESLRAILYKAAQEMLFNVVKHAGVAKATLRLRRRGGHVWLFVSDRGRGFNPEEPRRTGGFGLLSIGERVKLLGGRMKVRSAKGKGSTFLIIVPDSQPQMTQPKNIAIQGVPRHDPLAESGQYSAAGAS